MSKLLAQIKKIDTFENLNIITFDYNGIPIRMMSLDLSSDVAPGKDVFLNIKQTSIAIAKDFSGMLSYSNQINATIDSIQNGELLCAIRLRIFDDFLESVITLESSKRMDLKVGDEVTVMIKASEISIAEILQ